MKKYVWIVALTLGVLFSVSLWGRSPGYLTQWASRWKADCAARHEFVSEVASGQAPVGAEPVTWTNVTNCTLTGRTLRKTRGSNERNDAGATSVQTIGGKGASKANGFVEFRALENNKNRYLGLTHNFTSKTEAAMDFSLHLTSLPYRGATVAEVRENSVYKAETGYHPNDVFRIAVENGIVKYYRNGTSFYTSENKPAFPLVIHCSMLHLGATVAEVFIGTNASFVSPALPDKTPPVLSDYNIMPLGGTTVVSFMTDEPAITQLEYGLTLNYGNAMAVNTPNTEHRFSLIGLTQNTTYHYRVKARDTAGNLTTSKDMVLTTTSLTAGGMVGVLDKNQILIPANYTTFTPPPVGGQYVDSIFGTTITRLSDGWKTFKDGVHHEYATMSPFNLDNTMILLQGDNTGFFIVDRSGKLIARMEFSNSAEPRWSHTEREAFYYHDGNRLMKYNVTARRATTIATFSQYERITFGGGECDISEDGDHVIIAGDMRHIGLFQLSAGKMKRVIDLSALNNWAEAYITANNNVAVRWDEEGEGKYQGLGLFDGNMNFMRKVLSFGAHSDQTRDVNGDEIIVMGAYRDVNPPPGCENSGVMKVRLSDSKKTCLVPLDWDQEIHVSANTNGKHRYILVSGTDGKGTADLPAKLKPDWQKKWRPRVNELILVKTDGSERRRIVHHRGRVSDFYWWQPRATLSKDGKFAIFDSNYGFNPTRDYTDAFLVNLTNQK